MLYPWNINEGFEQSIELIHKVSCLEIIEVFSPALRRLDVEMKHMVHIRVKKIFTKKPKIEKRS
jgi:hypothetical protein